ncbi:hypothetical protein GCM10009665_54680 [Kitasatospora nipponensis]|uniref:Uncharacterized protein n=1 Tax=Kitasatospora nipponensis TaxID=258049 RepID=A0ABN1WQP5_9ACTN
MDAEVLSERELAAVAADTVRATALGLEKVAGTAELAALRWQALEQLRPGTVTALDVHVKPAPWCGHACPVVQHDQDSDDRPARHDDQPAAQPVRPPLADHGG